MSKKNNGITLLSLFDGMSCGQIAMKLLGVPVKKYYASEIDKFAILQTQHNFPGTIQLGDVKRWREWDIDWASIDLLLAGSPCQGFSFAGKQLAFDDPRSRLFFVFIDILNHIRSMNPNVKFLLENVNMKKMHRSIITQYCGLKPVRINSNLVSAQNRDRLYWSNIRTNQEGFFSSEYTDIPQPKDRGLLLRDILEEDVDEKYYVNTEKMMKYISKEFRIKKGYTQFDGEKSLPLMGESYTNWCGDYIAVAMRGRESACLSPKRTEYGKEIRKEYEAGLVEEKRKNIQQLEPRTDGKTNTITSVQKDNLILQLNPSKQSGGIQPYQQDRIYDENGICPALLADMSSGTHAVYQRPRGNNTGGLFEDKAPTLSANAWEQNNWLCLLGVIRRLTPLECSRLQTIPSWYEWVVSDTQIYKMLGNGWTVEVIAYILSFWKEVRERIAA